MTGIPRALYSSALSADFDRANTEDFLTQAAELDAMSSDTLSSIARWIAAKDATLPWMVERAKELMLWVNDGGYQGVLEAPQHVPRRLPAGIVGFCNQCRWPLNDPGQANGDGSRGHEHTRKDGSHRP